MEISWNGDALNMWRSSNVTVRNGVVDGHNAPTGMCLMFEGSEEHVHGGIVENVEARNCQGCFAGFPANGLSMYDVVCANPVCKSDNPPRGGKKNTKLWTSGDNAVEGVKSYDITVENGTYYNPCDESEGSLYYEPFGRKGEVFTNGGPDLTEIFEWTPKEEIQLTFSWDSCGLQPNFSDCSSWDE